MIVIYNIMSMINNYDIMINYSAGPISHHIARLASEESRQSHLCHLYGVFR